MLILIFEGIGKEVCTVIRAGCGQEQRSYHGSAQGRHSVRCRDLRE